MGLSLMSLWNRLMKEHPALEVPSAKGGVNIEPCLTGEHIDNGNVRMHQKTQYTYYFDALKFGVGNHSGNHQCPAKSKSSAQLRVISPLRIFSIAFDPVIQPHPLEFGSNPPNVNLDDPPKIIGQPTVIYKIPNPALINPERIILDNLNTMLEDPLVNDETLDECTYSSSSGLDAIHGFNQGLFPAQA
ncbi:hypothetical protein Cgig2_031993 [Carnegiea gigantea]|uniref:Uncharacterized protein n=1 Tax=Carnegiea gigantea TaxID=171969 RepID=A0A9Q1GMR7_9CARY|nr:hypothetical protein Cgig2_031993 [Carnegiea gigantea]